ncbi:MAG TPA: 50S ribosomal protein L23 [Sumerlaeia bacterium]|nr:50S ribosomal protein L23 [Sumerlaeia bacterium]
MKARPRDILIRPLITEDSTLGATLRERQYIFLVSPAANKIQIAQAVEEVFGVHVKNVNTLRQRGKVRTLRGRRGKRPDYKKAFVTLEAGHSLDLF